MLPQPVKIVSRIVVRATRIELAWGVLLITGTPPDSKSGASTDFRHARIHSQRLGYVRQKPPPVSVLFYSAFSTFAFAAKTCAIPPKNDVIRSACQLANSPMPTVTAMLN